MLLFLPLHHHRSRFTAFPALQRQYSLLAACPGAFKPFDVLHTFGLSRQTQSRVKFCVIPEAINHTAQAALRSKLTNFLSCTYLSLAYHLYCCIRSRRNCKHDNIAFYKRFL